MTLCGGQCFHWYPTPRRTFIGALGHSVFELREVQCDATARTKHAQEAALKPSGKRARATAARHGASAEAADGACCSCCWVEYRRLWPEPREAERLARQTAHGPPSHGTSKGRTVPASDHESDEAALSRYLALDVDLGQLWERWTDAPLTRRHPLVTYLIGNRRPLQSAAAERLCPHDTTLAHHYVPIRHLRQDLHSCLFSFLCSQNNNVARITAMVYSLCRAYGDHLCDVQLSTGAVRPPSPRSSRGDATSPRGRGKAKSDLLAAPSLKPLLQEGKDSAGAWLALYSFPSLQQLSSATEEQLRTLGFGYRSKYTVDAVQLITASPASKVEVRGSVPAQGTLQRQHGACYDNGFYASVLGLHGDYRQQRDMLLRLPGVGRKVADCVALFALGCTHIVPVDTHMAQVAVEYLATPAAASSSAACKSRKRTRGGDGLATSATPAPSWNDVLLAWGKQADALRLKRKQEKERSTGKHTAARLPGSASASSDKTPVPALYERHHDAIQESFRVLFGDFAGWAHSILFYYRMRKR